MGTISVESATLESLQSAYDQERSVAVKGKEYLEANCALDGDFGLILQLVHPLYNQGRDRGYEAFTAAAAALAQLGVQVGNALSDAKAREESVMKAIAAITQQLEALRSRVDELTQRPPTPDTGGSNSDGAMGPQGSGGYPRGRSSGQDAGGATANANANANVTTNVTTNVTIDTPRPPDIVPDERLRDERMREELLREERMREERRREEHWHEERRREERWREERWPDGRRPDDGRPDADDSGTGSTVPGGTSGADAERHAVESAYYRKLWDELAERDPLGRSAEDLRAQWEAREGIEIEGPGSFGYADESVLTVPGLGLTPGVGVCGMPSRSEMPSMSGLRVGAVA